MIVKWLHQFFGVNGKNRISFEIKDLLKGKLSPLSSSSSQEKKKKKREKINQLLVFAMSLLCSGHTPTPPHTPQTHKRAHTHTRHTHIHSSFWTVKGSSNTLIHSSVMNDWHRQTSIYSDSDRFGNTRDPFEWLDTETLFSLEYGHSLTLPFHEILITLSLHNFLKEGCYHFHPDSSFFSQVTNTF